MPVRMILTEGTVADCTQAHSLIADIPAEYLLADRGYDTNGIVAEAEGQGMEPVIPPRSHRKEQRYYDRALYKLRHLVENSFLDFKQWRGGCHPICQKRSVFPGNLPNPSAGHLDQVILTTRPSTTVADMW